MELKIKKKVSKKDTNYLRLDIEFMMGDADGDDTEVVKVKKEDYDNIPEVREFFHRIIKCVAGCCEAYQNGKGGYESYEAVKDYCLFFEKEFEDYADANLDCDENEYEKAMQEFMADRDAFDKLSEKYFQVDLGFCGFLNHPTNHDMYGVSSFQSYSLTYVNENGNEQDVDIIYTKEEEEFFETCQKID